LPAHNLDAERKSLLSVYAPTTAPIVQDAALELLAILGRPTGTDWINAFSRALKVATDSTMDPVQRVAAFHLIALQKEKDSGPLATSILGSEQDIAVQEAALRCQHSQAPGQAAALILKRWPGLAAPIRELGMSLLLETPEGMQALLNALDQKTVVSADVPWRGKVDLMNHDDAAIRNRARALLAKEIEGREKVVTAYADALRMKGNIQAGETVYRQVCGVCHTYEGKMGVVFGPDLGSIRNRDKSSIMTDILQPNRSIAVQYDLWMVFMKNGEKHSGIIQAETPTTVQLAPAAGQSKTLARSQIARMDMGKTSAMPEGLEQAISKQQMADLLAFLTQKE
jgi:putative heme-binding domain-containing protein